MHPESVYRKAQELLAAGGTSTEIARRLNVHRSTVENWRRRPRVRHLYALEDFADWRPPAAGTYAYLLGLYLGDGCIREHVRGSSSTLIVTLDAAYPSIVDESASAIVTTVPGVPLRRSRREGAVDLKASHPVWKFAFPQHGAGPKHLRPIVLEPWQEEITCKHPRELVRGLIQSDGCRCINRFKTKLPSGRIAEYEYVRYFFSNLSEDIKDIFCRHADQLGIRWSRANPRYVSIHDRKSVAILDSFVGPKR